MWPLLALGDFWLAGGLVPSQPAIGDSTKDVYGNTLAVGNRVKFVGTITAINLNDPHYGDIQVTPAYPMSNIVFIPDVQTGMQPQSPNFPVSNPQFASGPFGFHPWQLIKE